MIKTDNLSKKYNESTTIQFPDMEINKGESVLILGNSGVGKSTLLHMLAGILKPSKGSIHINDQNLYQLSGGKLDEFRGKNIGVVFQNPHFIQSITAKENIKLAQKISLGHHDDKVIDNLFERLNIDHRKTVLPFQMSQGERQRLAIIRGFVSQPSILLADEPTSALDDENCEVVINLLKEQAQIFKTSLLIVTHDSRLRNYFSTTISLKN